MSRITRAKAAEVAKQIYIDADVVLESQSVEVVDENVDQQPPNTNAKAPLGDIAVNSVSAVIDCDSLANDDLVETSKISGNRSRGYKHQPIDAALGTAGTSRQLSEIKEDEADDQPPSSADQHTADMSNSGHALLHGKASPAQPAVGGHIEPGTLQTSAAVEATKQLLTALSSSPAPSNGHGPGANNNTKRGKPITRTMPTTMQRTRSRSPVRLSTPQSQKSFRTVDSGYENYDELEAAAVEAASPARSTKTLTPAFTPAKSVQEDHEDPIRALDILEEAMERLTAEVPDVPTSPEKPVVKKTAPVVRATKASQARISIAHGPKDAPRVPSLGRPPRQSIGPNDGKRLVSGSSEKSDDAAVKKEVIIPHSKPRPMSMAFPAPPPPAKSTKPPTQSTFQLPGEIVAAKFRAAKEARLAKEAEEQKKGPFRARPVPASLGKGPSVRQTSSSIARESLITGKPVGPAVAHHRSESAVGTHQRAPSTNRLSQIRTSSVKPASRPGTAMALMSKVRDPSPSEASVSSTSAARPPSGAQQNKGKDVYNRPAQAQFAAEQAKREREEAAKRARAEASQLSRQWAEKQRQKKQLAMA